MSDVVWVDLGFAKVLQSMRFLDRTVARVGVVGAAAKKPSTDGRLQMGDVAIINEYGSARAHIPARHFTRSALHTPLAIALAHQVATVAINFGDTDAALHRAGEKLAERMRDAVYRGDFRRNAASTVKKKGFDHPLIDSSGLADAIGHELVRGSGDIVDAGAGDYQAFTVRGGA